MGQLLICDNRRVIPIAFPGDKTSEKLRTAADQVQDGIEKHCDATGAALVSSLRIPGYAGLEFMIFCRDGSRAAIMAPV